MKFPIVSSNDTRARHLEVDPYAGDHHAHWHQRRVIWEACHGISSSIKFWLIGNLTISREAGQNRESPWRFRVKYNTPEGTAIRESCRRASVEAAFSLKAISPCRSAPNCRWNSLCPSTNEWLAAKGVVAWVCPKADQYTFSPGMGVRFTDIAPDIRNRVLELVKSLQEVGRSAA